MLCSINPIRNRIENHLAAVRRDEASFNDDGTPINESLAKVTGLEELMCFRDFVMQPCAGHEDVQEKVRYLLDGTVGNRDTLLMTLLCDDGEGSFDGAVEKFLRSLLVEGEQRA